MSSMDVREPLPSAVALWESGPPPSSSLMLLPAPAPASPKSPWARAARLLKLLRVNCILLPEAPRPSLSGRPAGLWAAGCV
mgnify:CR=1 FL=1